MTHPSKRKGNKFERELVHDAEDVGLEAKRAYASNGKALGLDKECDVALYDSMGNPISIQAKRRKSIAQYLQPPDNVFMTVVRENYGNSLAIIRWVDWLRFLKWGEIPFEKYT